MKKMILCIGLVIALAMPAIPALAGWSGEVYQKSTVMSNQSTTAALSISTANMTAGRIIAAGAYGKGSIAVAGGGRTGLYNYSGVVTLWGSNNYTGSGTGGSWVPVATLTGTTTGQVSALTVPYMYYTVSYAPTRTLAVGSAIPTSLKVTDVTIYLYREQ